MIANLTVFLVSLNTQLYSDYQLFWTCIGLILGVLAGMYTFLKHKDLVYLLVFVWAYFGILFRYLFIDGIMSIYPALVMLVVVCLLVFVVLMVWDIVSKIRDL